MWSLHVCGLLGLPLVVFEWVDWVMFALVEGVGVMGIAGMLEEVVDVEGLG